MSEPYVPTPAPEPNGHHDPLPPRCPECGAVVSRVSLEEYRCTEHGIVRPLYGVRP